ncbi:MAG TPA: ASCH domain-containing protein [Chloroflexia bacterium]|nr:ASCH domain-containing protein [Chloroflexia bacterium]
MAEHIAILSHKSVLEKILSGEKTIESRFSRVKSLPYGQVSPGDIVYFKLSGGPVLGFARVANVEEYEDLTPARVEALGKRYGHELALSQDFLTRKLESKYVSFIFLEDVQPCSPWNYKQEGRSGWIILPPEEKTPASEEAASVATSSQNLLDFRSVGMEMA